MGSRTNLGTISGCEVHPVGEKPVIDRGGTNLQEAVSSLWQPAHLLALVHAGVHEAVDDGLCPRGSDRQACAVPWAVVHQSTRIQPQTDPKPLLYLYYSKMIPLTIKKRPIMALT